MIELVIASAIELAMVQSAAAVSARQELVSCLRQAVETAKSQKLATDAFPDFAKQQCSAQQAKLKAAIWAFDSKNKVPRGQSEADAEAQIEDYIATQAGRYEMASASQ